MEDFRVNRERTLRMLKKLSQQQWDCYGMDTERGKETVRRMVELLAGTTSITCVRFAPCSKPEPLIDADERRSENSLWFS